LMKQTVEASSSDGGSAPTEPSVNS
jgi:hypothetical protein